MHSPPVSVVFDEQNLVSSAGLVPVLELAGQTGLSRLIGEHVDPPSTPMKSGAVNPIGKPASIINAMICGADSIDDANVLCAGGTPHPTEEFPVHADDLAEFGDDRSLCIKAMIPRVVDRMYVEIDDNWFLPQSVDWPVPAFPCCVVPRVGPGMAGGQVWSGVKWRAAVRLGSR
jgi:hypothetical protein